MSHLLDLPDDLPERAGQLLDSIPKDMWHAHARQVLEQGLSTNQSIGIACSGGADSTFCLLLTYAAFPEKRNQMSISHYNHQLRGEESIKDELFVKEMGNKLGLRCLVESHPKNLDKADENSLRQDRLKFWEKLQMWQGMSLLLQGHHLDDVAETLLWRIPRGVSVDGLISPKPISQIGNLTIIRPFISLGRDLIRNSLKKVGVAWREDASNSENRYLRNKMRNQVIPFWKQSCDRDLLQGISSTQELLQLDSEALDFHADQTFEECMSGSKLMVGPLARYPEATQKRVLIKWLKVLAPDQATFARLSTKVGNVLSSLKAGNFSTIQLSDNWTISEKEGFLELADKDLGLKVPYISIPPGYSTYLPNAVKITVEQVELGPELLTRIHQKLVDQNTESFLSPAKLDGNIYARSRIDGDTYKPLGAAGTKKISDWMIDRKWTNKQKLETPIFLNDSGEILWIPGFPPAESAKVTQADVRVIHLTYRHSGT